MCYHGENQFMLLIYSNTTDHFLNQRTPYLDAQCSRIVSIGTTIATYNGSSRHYLQFSSIDELA